MKKKKWKVWIKSAFVHLIHTLFFNLSRNLSLCVKVKVFFKMRMGVESIHKFKSINYKFKIRGQYKAHILAKFLLDA